MTHSGNDLGDRLAILMRRAGLKNSDIAEVAGVDVTTVSKWRSGVHRPDHAKLVLIADLARSHGVDDATAEELESGRSGGRIRRAFGVPDGYVSRFARFDLPQQGRVCVQQLLLELTRAGADDPFIAWARQFLTNADNYVGLVDGSGTDEEKVAHLHALAVGVRAALKDWLKKGKGR